ncbi:MAG: hypothetical protein P8R54_23475 [Myxococcota bacterium]|nr:hypothetical protein [Myxococcota bacterium]
MTTPDNNAAIINCDPRLSFACPKTWGRLQATDDPLRRICRVCSQPVCYRSDAAAQSETEVRMATAPATPASDPLHQFFESMPLSGDDHSEDAPSEEDGIEAVADAAMALITALESQDPEAATGDLIFIEED